MTKDYIKNVSEVSGQNEEQTIQEMIKEREKEIRQLTKEIVLLKQFQMCV